MSSSTKEEEKKGDGGECNVDTGTETNSAKRPVSTTSEDDDSSPSGKKVKPEEAKDFAEALGFKAGDRLEVEWDIHNEEDETGSSTEHRWWGATLVEWNGERTHDGMVIRTLDYDPYPEGGFPERSQEQVVFSPEPSTLIQVCNMDQLRYRREHEELVYALTEENLRDQLNAMLQAIVATSATFGNLEAAQKARVASIVAEGKERLIQVIADRKHSGVITAADVPGIFAEAFGDMRTQLSSAAAAM